MQAANAVLPPLATLIRLRDLLCSQVASRWARTQVSASVGVWRGFEKMQAGEGRLGPHASAAWCSGRQSRRSS